MKIEIALTEPGLLRSLVKERIEEFKNADLKVIGRMNEADLKFLKQATGRNGFIKGLDLSYATGVTNIDRNSFEEGGILTTFRFPSSVTELGWGAFCMCDKLNSVSMTSDIERIDNFAFNGCTALTSISLPKNVKEIGEQSLIGCSKLEEFKILLSNRNYSTFEGVLFNKKGDTLLKYPAGKEDKAYEFPANTFHIGNYAFFMCEKLTSIVVPEGITTIGKFAMASCSSLQTISLPSSVESIGEGAFSNNENLHSLNIQATTPPAFTPDENVAKSLYVYVPMRAVESYKNAEGWKDVKNLFGK